MFSSTSVVESSTKRGSYRRLSSSMVCRLTELATRMSIP